MAFTLLVVVTGCLYTTRSRLPSHIRTFTIPTFENQTSEFFLAQLLTDRLIEQFQTEGDLKVASPDEADSIVRGTILDYQEEALTFGGVRESEVGRRRVRITVSVEFYDRVRGAVVWRSHSLERWGEFEPDEGLEVGIGQAVAKIAEDILSNAVERW